ncbi:hypothetical protein NOVO_07600 [Rickettsiales bacterium Ac37b]|nr:hypothetical protein NOVO_07600 [Rickettsiales bacterium Ac37b]
MFKGKRSITGGRKIVRSALYMATLAAIRFNQTIREFYLRLKANGKSSTLPITACMRKFLVIINAQTYRQLKGLITF